MGDPRRHGRHGYQYFQAADRGEAFEIPPELTEEEQLR
jgi:hypothetical protein